MDNIYAPQTGTGYSYLPEMQGMTDIQNRQFVNNMNTQVSNFNNAGARSNLQSSGAFLAGRANLGARTAQGQQDIGSTNMYKNALFALQDRRTREQRQFQEKMADTNFQRQVQMFKMKQDAQNNLSASNLIGGGIGLIGNAVMGQLFPDPLKLFLTKQLGINKPNETQSSSSTDVDEATKEIDPLTGKPFVY